MLHRDGKQIIKELIKHGKICVEARAEDLFFLYLTFYFIIKKINGRLDWKKYDFNIRFSLHVFISEFMEELRSTSQSIQVKVKNRSLIS